MERSTKAQPFPSARVAEGLFIDSRRALWHEDAHWLAIADLHYGYEIERQQSGGLFPEWGMATIADQLRELLSAYQPDKLILVGDIVDGRAPQAQLAAIALLKEISTLAPSTKLILIRGNHDRGAILEAFPFCDSHREGDFLFHHGHQFDQIAEAQAEQPTIHVTGHLHPARSLGDGAGLRLKLPALTRTEVNGQTRYTLPAFSPWAAGGGVISGDYWLCGEGRILTHRGQKL